MIRERSCISNSLWIALVAVYIVVASTTASLAQEKIKLGKIKLGKIKLGKISLLPQLQYSSKYDDNFFSDNENENRDCPNIFTPSIGLTYKGSRPESFIRLNYAADLVAYPHSPDSNYQTQKPYAEFSYRAPCGFYFKGSNLYTKTADPFGTFSDYGVGERIKRRYNKADGRVGCKFGRKYSVESYVVHNSLRYYEPEDKRQDRDVESYGISFSYDWTSETELLVQYKGTQYDFPSINKVAPDTGGDIFRSGDTSTDRSTEDFLVGAKFGHEGKLQGEIKVGYSTVAMNSKFDPDGEGSEKDGTWATETALSFRPMERTSLSMDLRRSYVESWDDQDANYYVDSTSGLNIEREFARGISANLRMAYSDWRYLNEAGGLEEKSFDIYTVRLGMDWEVNKYITTGLNCQYKHKDASEDIFEGEEYTKSRLTAYIEGRY